VDRAIELRPDSGLYYYGRGRIYLMLGAEGQAMADFQKAADLGSRDARDYLQRQKENRST
jgi:tetratricopeptide (TPR) repeat protein